MAGSVILVVSCMALWLLLMPATLYGVLGCILVLVLACVTARRRQDWWKGIKDRFHAGYLLPVALVCWVAAQKFYERWKPSGMVATVAERLGTETGILLAAAAVCGVIAALPVLLAAAGWVRHTAEKQKFEVLSVSAPAKEETMADKRKISRMDVLFCLLLCLCIAMQFALNPWSDTYPGSDSTVFLYIGQRMREGAVPYRDLFDHKGLLLYFIEYAGLSLGGGNFAGVWFLEIGNLFVTALLFLQVTKLFSSRKTVQYAAVALVLCTVDYYIVYEGGNLTEEYALPWISLALYIFLKYFKQNSYRFYEIVLLGISFTAVLFLRVNMIAVWAAFLPVVLIGLIVQKKWSDIGTCILGFLLGTAVGMIPFLGYGAATGSLSDMLRYYIGFNFGYSDSEGGILPLLSTAWFLFRQTAVWSAALAASFLLFRKNRIWQLNLWFLGVTLLLASMSGRLYYHYGMILLPAMLVPVVLVLDKAGKNWNTGVERYLVLTAGVFFAVQTVVSVAGYEKPQESELAAYIEENTAESDAILVLGNDCRYYLESGRNAAGKFFYQTPPINVSDAVYEEFVTELTADRPELIVVIGDREQLKAADNNQAAVCALLEEWENAGAYVYTEMGANGIYLRVQ